MTTAFDWDALRRFADTLSAARRAQVRDHWAAAAQMEHASIASFDRFSLQLLAVAAPPSLIEQAHRAAIDEVRHAQLSFAIASIYAQQALGPGPLVIAAHAFADVSVSFVVQSAVEEGCVGETLAAADAEAASEHASHPVLKQALSAIAADEAEHAALAYRFAAWALAGLGEPARQAAERGFELAIARAQTPQHTHVDEAHDAWLQDHGRLSFSTRVRQRDKALLEVIAPARAQLLHP